MRYLAMISLILLFTANAQDVILPRVKKVIGEATVSINGTSKKVVENMEIEPGAVIKTSEKSFVRIMFPDSSQMNVGATSEMKIEKFGGGDAGVIDLVKGKIRSQVSKDYLQQKDKEKSKMFVKTPNAVMGIRGTKFEIATNGINTSAVLFEGSVVFNDVAPGSMEGLNTDALEAIVDKGVAIHPGEFSVARPDLSNPTVPSLMNAQQFEKLEKNEDYSTERAPSDQGAGEASVKSVVPGGLGGTVVANQPVALQNEVAQTGVATTQLAVAEGGAEAAKGYEQDGQVKPTNGSFLHIESGTVIAPPKDSVYDPNTNTFVPAASAGTVNADGSYQPPKDVTITDSGKVLAMSGGQMVEIKTTSVVMGSTTLGDVMKVVSTAPAGSTAQLNTFTAPAAGGGTTATNPVSPNLSPAASTYQEAPTLCSTCGGIIPGSAGQQSTTTTTTINTNSGSN